MATAHLSVPNIILIVAATTKLGIGKSGALPWPQLKQEMAYFARVTKRVEDASKYNAVIMGRKTWESIPPKFRPLRGRINLVLTQSAENIARDGNDLLMTAPNLDAAIVALGERGDVDRVFVIGGAAAYAAALQSTGTKYILLTRIHTNFDCDTFFPLEPDESGGRWAKQDVSRLAQFTGEDVGSVNHRHSESGVDYEFHLYQQHSL